MKKLKLLDPMNGVLLFYDLTSCCNSSSFETGAEFSK